MADELYPKEKMSNSAAKGDRCIFCGHILKKGESQGHNCDMKKMVMGCSSD